MVEDTLKSHIEGCTARFITKENCYVNTIDSFKEALMSFLVDVYSYLYLVFLCEFILFELLPTFKYHFHLREADHTPTSLHTKYHVHRLPRHPKSQSLWLLPTSSAKSRSTARAQEAHEPKVHSLNCQIQDFIRLGGRSCFKSV